MQFKASTGNWEVLLDYGKSKRCTVDSNMKHQMRVFFARDFFHSFSTIRVARRISIFFLRLLIRFASFGFWKPIRIDKYQMRNFLGWLARAPSIWLQRISPIRTIIGFNWDSCIASHRSRGQIRRKSEFAINTVCSTWLGQSTDRLRLIPPNNICNGNRIAYVTCVHCTQKPKHRID